MKRHIESFKISSNLLIWLTPLQITTKKRDRYHITLDPAIHPFGI